MSYIPFYIRPISSSSQTSPTASTPSLLSRNRSVTESTVLSPSASLASSACTSPTRSMKDENFGSLPKATGLKRYERRSTSYVGYREDYIRKQSDRVSGRKSFEERLKSLEADASVKLKIRKGSQNRRRRSTERDINLKLRSRKRETFNRSATSPALTRKENQIESSSSLTVSSVSSPISSPPPPLLDVIESHQSPLQSSPTELQSVLQNNDELLANNEEILNLTTEQPSRIVERKFNPKAGESTTNFYQQISKASENQFSTDHHREETLANEAKSSSNVNSPNQSSLTSVINQKKAADGNYTTAIDQSTLEEDIGKRNSQFHFLPIHDQDMKNGTNLVKSVPNKILGLSRKLSKDASSDVSKSNIDVLPSSPNIITNAQLLVDEKTSVNENAEISKPIARKEKSIVVDVTTDNAVIPVELRSPRGGIPTAAGRVAMREKRNARMFVFPSSDDSETENVLAKLNRSHEKKFHSASTEKNDQNDSIRFETNSMQEAGSNGSSLVSSSSSLPTEGKKSSSEDRSTQTTQRKEQRRKSSRSPKRSVAKRSNRRSKSNHDQSTTEEIQHTRTLSSGGQSVNSLSVSSAETVLGMSPKTAYRQDRTSSPTEKGINTVSMFEKNNNSIHTKYKTEYEELSTSPPTKNLSHNTMNNVSDDLPSPHQQAVADAVNFGFTNTNEVIPYIDDAISPEEQSYISPEESKKSTDADLATTQKAFPLSRGRRPVKRRDEPRRTSYEEALQSNNTEETSSYDSRLARRGMVFSDSDKEEFLANLGGLVRSNSADSVLSTSDASTSAAVVRRNTRSSSADRNSLKGIYRRSYQIATNQLTEPDDARAPSDKSQAGIRRLKHLFVETSPSYGNTPEDSRRSTRHKAPGAPAVLSINHWDDSIVKEGFLFFKVAINERGKRTSSQKSWKLIWVVLRDRLLFLCKDWSRNKQDSFNDSLGQYSSSTFGIDYLPTQLPLEEEEPLNIQGSLVSIAYNYLKRKHVFRLTTFNGSEYLFQAEDRDDMLIWIHSIQIQGNRDDEDVSINENLIIRKTNEIESNPKPDKRSVRRSRSPKPSRRANGSVKEDGSRRFKWRGSVNKIVKKFGQGQSLLQGSTFDVLLEDCPPSPSNELVPLIVDVCCRIVEQQGLSFVGIYRVPGNNGTIAALQEELNLRGADSIDLENDNRFCDLTIVSSLLKSFFRRLPDPLFTNELYDDFITVNRKKDPEERLNGLRRLIHMLPPHHYQTLKFLVTHLRKVADNAELNKMENRNLAIVFGPTLVRNTATDSMSTMVTDMSDQCRIVESVLQHTYWFFTDDENIKFSIPSRPILQDEGTETLDQLLANFIQSAEDITDSSTDPSRSKTSFVSGNNSIAPNLINSCLGAEEKWTPASNQGDDNERNIKENSEDDTYEFKISQAMIPEKQLSETKSPPLSPSQSPLSSTSSASANLNSRSLPNNFKPAISGPKEHLPLDYQSRLREFFAENLEWLARTDSNRPLPPFSSSSAESSPQVTPRTSVFGFPQPAMQRTFPRPARRLSEGKLTPINVHFVEYTRQSSTPKSSPLLKRKSRFSKESKATSHSLNYWHTPALIRDVRDYQLRPVWVNRSRSELSSRESLMADVESDSDTSIQLGGNAADETIRNLTYSLRIDRGSRRQSSTEASVLRSHLIPSSPLKPLNGNISHHSVVDVGSTDSLLPRKTAKELHQLRKLQRQQYRALMKTRTNDLSRWTSDENVHNIADSFRALHFDFETQLSSMRKQPSLRRKNVHRRHTLGSGDFFDQNFWDHSHYTSLQNITRDVHDMTLSRLRPQLRASAPTLTQQTTSARFV